ncbi:MAG: hypothetical protein HOC74_41265 [Gemmatimonadetes bacterium]|nr:hypothetical protein [Gemmatimonadota bacterium]
MSAFWRWWGKKEGEKAVDAWVRKRLSGDVPEDSFDRVWSGAVRRVEATSAAEAAPWELALTVRRLQMWRRGLAFGLTMVTVLLVAVVMEVYSMRQELRERVELAVEVEERDVRVGWLGRIRSAESGESGLPSSYGLLRDRRIIFNRDNREEGS